MKVKMQQFDLDNFIFVKYLFNFFVSYFDNTLHGGGGGGAAHGPNSLLRHCLNKRVQNVSPFPRSRSGFGPSPCSLLPHSLVEL